MMNEQCGPRSRTLCVAFIHIFVSCYFQSVLHHGYINKGGLWLRLSVDLSISLLPKISSLKVLTLTSHQNLAIMSSKLIFIVRSSLVHALQANQFQSWWTLSLNIPNKEN